VNRDAFCDAALVLLGHGTSESEDAAAPVHQHAAALRARGLFDSVHAAFWKQSPRVDAVLAALAARRVFLVPLFMSEGYFSAQVIPRALGLTLGETPSSRVLRRGGQTLIYCRPVGTHERMTEVVLARAREVVERFPFPRPPPPLETTLLLAGHGTERAQSSRQSVEEQVRRLRAMGLYAAVHGIFLEESPRIEEGYDLAATRNVVIVPFFLSDGPHTQEDIPARLGEPESVVRARRAAGQPTWRNPTERRGRRVWFSGAVGTAPAVADVILERVRELASVAAP
jgi:sirohydrochlorin cobaltochelatase